MSRKNKSKYMGPCPAATKAGRRCPNNGNARDGYLCHVHRGAEEIRFYDERKPEPKAAAVRAPATVSVEEIRFWKRNVRCEAILPDGRQCAVYGRALHMFMDGKVRCHIHGGGRQGRSQVQALREVLGVV